MTGIELAPAQRKACSKLITLLDHVIMKELGLAYRDPACDIEHGFLTPAHFDSDMVDLLSFFVLL